MSNNKSTLTYSGKNSAGKVTKRRILQILLNYSRLQLLLLVQILCSGRICSVYIVYSSFHTVLSVCIYVQYIQYMVGNTNRRDCPEKFKFLCWKDKKKSQDIP